MEYLVFYSNCKQLLIFIQNFETLLSILPSCILNFSQLLIETVNCSFFGLATESLCQSHQFFCFFDELLIKLHFVIQLLPYNLIFEDHIFAISNGYQFKEELLHV